MNPNDISIRPIGHPYNEDTEYVKLVSHISELWENAKCRASIAINTELLDANWKTGQYIVEFEQGGSSKAKYGDKLLVTLSKARYQLYLPNREELQAQLNRLLDNTKEL